MRKIRKPAIGARPGTLVIDPGASKPIVRVFDYDANEIQEHESLGIDEIRRLVGTGGKLPESGRRGVLARAGRDLRDS